MGEAIIQKKYRENPGIILRPVSTIWSIGAYSPGETIKIEESYTIRMQCNVYESCSGPNYGQIRWIFPIEGRRR